MTELTNFLTMLATTNVGKIGGGYTVSSISSNTYIDIDEVQLCFDGNGKLVHFRNRRTKTA